MSSALFFASSLYSEAAVRATMRAYDGLARFELRVSENELELHVFDSDPELGEQLLDELANHVLFETVTQRRAMGVRA